MKKLKISDQELKNYVNKICREILLSNWRPDYVVGITRGGLVPAVMISQYLEIPMHTLNVSLRDSDILPESNLWMPVDAFNQTCEILIVDDINDSGATLDWIQKDWQSSCISNDVRWDNNIWGNNVRFAVLVNNEASKFKDIDYSGVIINKLEDPVWVDFPWEAWWTL
jgi:xanthine phosphoribosyltransferase